jgi:peptidyl-prolyl cis-trans isomerase C
VIRSTARAALAMLAVSLLLAGCSPAGRPLARVGTQTITSSDLLEAARGNEQSSAGAPEEAKRALLDDLVRRELILEAARRRGSDTTRYARQFAEDLRDRLSLETLYARMAPQDPGVTEAETRRFYDWRGTQAAVRIIYSPDRGLLEAALAALKRGEPFAAVADRFNMPGTVPAGGAIGLVSPGQLVPPLDEALLTLPAGQVGGPYETSQGMFLMTVDRRQSAELPEYALVQSQLAETVRQRKVRQAMSQAFEVLWSARNARVEKDAATRLFQLMTPARVGDGIVPPTTSDDRAEVLARWDGGDYTVGDALDDLNRPDVQKPPAGMTPAIQQWIKSRVTTRLMRDEARRRHLAEEPAVARRIRGEYERYLLESEFQASISAVPAPNEALLRQVWDMVKGQYQQVQRANVQWAIVPDSATTARVAELGRRPGATLEEAVRGAGARVQVHREVVSYPNADPAWVSMRDALSRMQPGEWAGPERVREGFRFMQVIDKVQGPVTFENLTGDLRANLEANALQIAREQRLEQYTDSLKSAIRTEVFAANLRSVPWPPPGTIDVGH